jgi:hypothetical protein
MITWIPYTGYGTMEQREKPPRNESFTQREQWNSVKNPPETKVSHRGRAIHVQVHVGVQYACVCVCACGCLQQDLSRPLNRVEVAP